MTWALTPATSPLTGDDFRKRRPHPSFKRQYDAELKATKLSRENPLIDVYILSCGIPYGCGEDLLFQLMKFAWLLQYNESVGIRSAIRSIPLLGDGSNVVPMIYVKDLAQLMISTLKGQMIDRFVMAVDKGNCKLKEVMESISKAFSNGQVEQVTADHALTLRCVSELLVDYITSDISAVNELLGRVKTTNANGFVASIDQIKGEFLEARGIHPLRILICGPPLSGKSTAASRLSYRYSLPLVTVDSLIAEAKKNEGGYWQQFAQNIQGEISPSILLDLLKWKLQEIRCKNQGFVLDGIPSNADFADALWADSNNWPHIFVELECSDAFLRDRARQDPSMMLGIGNTDEFDGRLSQYRATNPADENHLFYSFDHLTIRALTVNVEKQKDNLISIISTFIGRPHNFGKPASLILRDTEEMAMQKRLKAERLLKLENELREAEEAKKRERELLILRQQEQIEQEETRLLAKFSKPQREWLVKTVAPTLAEGLCFVIKDMPEDPIQLLGCFLGTKLPPELQADLVSEFQPEEEDDDYEEEDDVDGLPPV
jgi:adenylate kinase